MTSSLQRYATAAILVVDDDQSNLALLVAVLQRAGIVAVHTESDPRRVADRLPALAPDLVLLDLNMPHLDGYQVLAQIQRYAAGRYLPVLLLTGAADADAAEHGAAGYLIKPYDLDELLSKVEALLGAGASE